MVNYVICIFSYIIGFIFGYKYTKYKNNKKTDGILHIDNVDNSIYAEINNEDILNKNIKNIYLEIKHY